MLRLAHLAVAPLQELAELLKGSDGKMGKTKHLNESDLDALEAYLRTL